MLNVTKSFADDGAKLYICSTPIGNLADISERLQQTLRSVDVVLCEDTRHTRKLLAHCDIHPPQVYSYHQHNEQSRQAWAVAAWQSGKSMALVSDAGTPLLSDPGALLVDTAIEQGVPVIPVPGPSALLAALVGSGLPLQPFAYLGFLPRSAKAAKQWLGDYLALPMTLIFYEAPHRLAATVEWLADLFGDQPAALAKELTKQHETFIRGTLFELRAYTAEHVSKGEYVILIDNRGGAPVEVSAEDTFAAAVEMVGTRMAAGVRHKTAVQEAAQAFSVNRRDLYNATLRAHEANVERTNE